jgi:hypothetical protein
VYMMYAPCHKSWLLVAFEIIEKSDTFCGREHTLSANARSYRLQNTDVRECISVLLDSGDAKNVMNVTTERIILWFHSSIRQMPE